MQGQFPNRHPGLWRARAHFPLVPTKDTWRREMGVVQSASCHIHWLACSRAAWVLHPLRAMATAVPVLRIAIFTPLLDAATTGLICAADAAQFDGLHRWSTARAGERSRVPDELLTAATIRYCSTQERTLALQPRLLRCPVDGLIVKHRRRVGGADGPWTHFRSPSRSCAARHARA